MATEAPNPDKGGPIALALQEEWQEQAITQTTHVVTQEAEEEAGNKVPQTSWRVCLITDALLDTLLGPQQFPALPFRG